MQCRAGGRPATYSTTVKAAMRLHLHPFTPRHQLINGLVTYPQGMQDEWASYPGHDLNSPPPGAAPGACLGCQGTGRTWREYMAVGPCRAIDLDPGEVGSVPVLGLCKYCKGYGWTWHTKLY